MNRFKAAMFAGAAIFAFSMPSHAASVINPDGSVSLDATDPFTWTVVANASMGSGFSGTEQSTIDYSFLGTSGNSYSFSYSLANTSPGDSASGPSIAVFGFNVSGSPISVLAPAGDEFQEGTGGNFNGLNPGVQYCFYSGSNCNGGGNSGVYPNEGPATGTFTINYSSLPANIVLSDFATRFQRTGADFKGSASGFGRPGAPGNVPAVPEPSTWAMMILGFGLIGVIMRKQRQRAAVCYS